MKTTANNIFFILNISNLFPLPLWKGQNLKKRREKSIKRETLQRDSRSQAHEWYTSFVLFPQASEPSVNFNISNLVYLGIYTYQRNFGSHETVGMSARPSVRRNHRLTNVKWHFVVRVGACNQCLLDDKHPCLVNCQLSAKRYPLTSIAWPYRRLRFQLDVKYFIIIFRWPVICF